MEVQERAASSSRPSAPPAHVPRIPNATVRRDALLARLHEAGECRLVLVTAAAGSGKSSLLAHWAGELDQPVAWLSCTDAHADEAVFWSDLARAVAEAWAGEGILGAEVLHPGEVAAPAILLEQLRTVAAAGVVVVDDFHLAAVAPAALVTFISSLPTAVRLVLSTRTDPPFSLARMRVQGTLLEVRQADLAFSQAETAEALQAIDVELDEADVEQLHAVTEGWPAGVHLLAISLRDHPELGVDLARLAADDRNLADFLLNEVVDRQRPEVQEFLTITAELGSFDPELVDDVTGRTDGATLLDEVRSGNLFLVEDVGTAARYRYHHLFLEFLRLRLQAQGPDAARDVHRRAGEAHARRGNWAEAVRHLLEAGELDAARVLLGNQITQAATIDLAGGATVARRWLAEHGETQLDGDTSGFLECTMALHVGGDVEEAELWLRRWREREHDLDHTGKVLLHGAWSFHHVFCGDPHAALDEVERAKALIEQEPVDDRWSDSLLLMELQPLLWQGRLDEVRAVASAGMTRPSLPAPIALVRLPAFVAQADLRAGELGRAEATATRALRAADALDLPELHFGRAEPDWVLAAVAIEQDRLDDADEHLERLMRVVEVQRPPLEVLAHLALADLAEARGDRAGVDQAIERARAAQPWASPVVVAHIDRAAAIAALRRGDVARARPLVEAQPAGVHRQHLAARLALAERDPTAATELLAEVDEGSLDRRQRIEHGVLLALATRTVDRARAAEHLAHVLATTEAQGFHRTLVAEGPALWDLLEAVSAHGRVAAHVEALLDTARRTVPTAQVVDQGSLVDPLSERELEVLRYLASRLDSSEIAAALYLSVNTVRTHVKAIYRKLAVSSRPDAVARGRELGLL